MAFPVLKTRAVAQYPLGQQTRFATQSVRFLDGSQQRFRLYWSGLRKWVINLSLLDETELSSLIDFVDAQGGDTFSFTDPVTGQAVAKCIISAEKFDAVLDDEMRGDASLTIEEIP
jgi:hypothetical protein